MGETEAALLAQRVKKEHTSDEPEPEPDVALADGSAAAAPGSEPEAVTADEKLLEVDQSADEMSSSNSPSGILENLWGRVPDVLVVAHREICALQIEQAQRARPRLPDVVAPSP